MPELLLEDLNFCMYLRIGRSVFFVLYFFRDGYVMLPTTGGESCGSAAREMDLRSDDTSICRDVKTADNVSLLSA